MILLNCGFLFLVKSFVFCRDDHVSCGLFGCDSPRGKDGGKATGEGNDTKTATNNMTTMRSWLNMNS